MVVESKAYTEHSMLGIRGHVELSHMEERLKMVLGPKLDLLALDLLTEAAVTGTLTSESAKRDAATQFLIQCAAACFAKDVLGFLAASAAVTVLEPLVVGLRIYLGESPHVAKEILEIGNDVAVRIRETERGGQGIDLTTLH
jgi:hypothetical protein